MMAKPMALPRCCPALFISAPASHQGKTTLTAGLARYHRNQGRQVRVFKTGPDFLDPLILQQASGQEVYALDLWMTGEQDCRQRLYEAADSADLILVEGAMGLFDGTPCSADLARLFEIPVVTVIDASAMAQTFAAIACGLTGFDPALTFYGVIANRVGSARHAQLLKEKLPASIRLSGSLMRDSEITLPERHLGLVQAGEIADLEHRLEAAAALIAHTDLTELPPAISFVPTAAVNLPRLLAGKTIAIAHDAAFSFLYPANRELLRELGATLTFFSPLADSALPDADAVYLPGGYPELFMRELSSNVAMATALRQHVADQKPLYAECGGMLYLLETLTDVQGQSAPMLGLLPGHGLMQKKLAGLGLHSLEQPDGILRGHAFHYSRTDSPLTPAVYTRQAQGGPSREALFQHGRITASYMHCYFPSNPTAAARFFL